jgi:hypothetical protein
MACPRTPPSAPGSWAILPIKAFSPGRAGPGAGRARGGDAVNKKAGGGGPFAWRRAVRSGGQRSPQALGAGSGAKESRAPPRGCLPPSGTAGEGSTARVHA